MGKDHDAARHPHVRNFILLDYPVYADSAGGVLPRYYSGKKRNKPESPCCNRRSSIIAIKKGAGESAIPIGNEKTNNDKELSNKLFESSISLKALKTAVLRKSRERRFSVCR